MQPIDTYAAVCLVKDNGHVNRTTGSEISLTFEHHHRKYFFHANLYPKSCGYLSSVNSLTILRLQDGIDNCFFWKFEYFFIRSDRFLKTGQVGLSIAKLACLLHKIDKDRIGFERRIRCPMLKPRSPPLSATITSDSVERYE